MIFFGHATDNFKSWSSGKHHSDLLEIQFECVLKMGFSPSLSVKAQDGKNLKQIAYI